MILAFVGALILVLTSMIAVVVSNFVLLREPQPLPIQSGQLTKGYLIAILAAFFVTAVEQYRAHSATCERFVIMMIDFGSPCLDEFKVRAMLIVSGAALMIATLGAPIAFALVKGSYGSIIALLGTSVIPLALLAAMMCTGVLSSTWLVGYGLFIASAFGAGLGLPLLKSRPASGSLK